MAATGNRGGGQRSKGARRFVGTRVPVKNHDLLPQAAAMEGYSNVSEWVAAMIDDKLKSLDFDKDNQERLPLEQMAS